MLLYSLLRGVCVGSDCVPLDFGKQEPDIVGVHQLDAHHLFEGVAKEVRKSLLARQQIC